MSSPQIRWRPNADTANRYAVIFPHINDRFNFLIGQSLFCEHLPKPLLQSISCIQQNLLRKGLIQPAVPSFERPTEIPAVPARSAERKPPAESGSRAKIPRMENRQIFPSDEVRYKSESSAPATDAQQKEKAQLLIPSISPHLPLNSTALSIHKTAKPWNPLLGWNKSR